MLNEMSAATDTPGVHRCPVCLKTYKRREHLQRHRSSHSSERPHRCILCNASFQRTDVLKRHLQTCDGAPNTSSGRRRACDRCVRQKKACNSGQPCQNCERRSVACQYSNLTNAQTGAASSSNSTPSGTPQTQMSLPTNIPGNHQAHPEPTTQLSSSFHSVQGHSNFGGGGGGGEATPVTISVTGPPVSGYPGHLHHHHPGPHPQQHPHHQPEPQHGQAHAQQIIHHDQPHSQPQQHVPHHDITFHHHHHLHTDVHFDDLDALIHQAVSHYPVMDHQHMTDDWLGVEFSSVTSTNEQPQHEQHECESSPSSPGSVYRHYTFNFLYDFTSRTGLVSSFECVTLSQRQLIVATFLRSYYEQQHQQLQQFQQLQQMQQMQQMQQLDFTAGPQLMPAPDAELVHLRGPDPAMPPGVVTLTPDLSLASWSSWLHNPIVLKLQKVILLVKEVVTIKRNNSTVTLTWSPALEHRCLQFFSPARFAKFIELYWSVWHPNVNFLHRPTFDPINAKTILLAAMALIG